MTPSLNEIESTVFKAARGAGLAWGLAEEMAQAARWLADHGFSWVEPVTACLEAVEAEAGRPAAPIRQGSTWSPPGPVPLNPALCGPLLSDLMPTGGDELRFERVGRPILLLPFAARVARDLPRRLTLTWPGTGFACSGSGVLTAGAGFEPAGIVTVVLAPDPKAIQGSLTPILTGAARQPIPDTLLHRLDGWAKRTYVPASLESRLAGAGAGLTDND